MAKVPLPDKLNICMVSQKFPILGRAADHGFLWPIARRLVESGHQVTVLSWKNPQGKKEIQQDNVMAFFLGEGTSHSIEAFPELVRNKFASLHQQNPFHLVHSIDRAGYLIGKRRKNFRVAMAYDVDATHMAELFAIMGMAQETLTGVLRTAAMVSVKYIVGYYGKDRPLLNTADAVFVTSPQQMIALERYYLFPEMRTYRVPYGIEITDLSPREKSDELRKKLGLPGNALTVVTITDMTEIGEMRNLLRAFERVAVKKPSSRMIIVGHGPLKKEIEFEMLNLALASKVIFTGAIPNVALPDYIALADVFVNISSRTSGFEPSLLEAMAQKKVIIGSEVSPMTTIVEDGRDGFLVRPADVHGLSNLLVQIFSDQLPAREIGENARNKILNLFDMEKMVRQTVEAYNKTLLSTGWYDKPKLKSAPTPPTADANKAQSPEAEP
ncbi:MAG: glycosyltransferase family 4 protein [Bdellovibrionales bacterium]|nr:glycosyltransferase family 4 protein [Bdellovibrionales bacterium]